MRTLTDMDSFREKLPELVVKFDKDKNYYPAKGYPEAQALHIGI